MDREKIIARLLELPSAIAAAEMKIVALEAQKRKALETLLKKEDDFWLNPPSNLGKNAEIRAAQLRAYTYGEQSYCEGFEWHIKEARIVLTVLQNELSALKAVARIIGGQER
jgi:hypothetical protein